jgi:hypothetical protein
MRPNEEARRWGERTGPLGCSLRGSENGSGFRLHHRRLQARRDLRTAAVKLSHLAAWHAKRGCCCSFEATPVLIGEIIEQLWRAASTLAMEKRR